MAYMMGIGRPTSRVNAFGADMRMGDGSTKRAKQARTYEMRTGDSSLGTDTGQDQVIATVQPRPFSGGEHALQIQSSPILAFTGSHPAHMRSPATHAQTGIFVGLQHLNAVLRAREYQRRKLVYQMAYEVAAQQARGATGGNTALLSLQQHGVLPDHPVPGTVYFVSTDTVDKYMAEQDGDASGWMWPKTPDDLVRDWSFFGMKETDWQMEIESQPMQTGTAQFIDGASVSGDAHMYNMFGSTTRIGDTIGFVGRPFAVQASEPIWDASGTSCEHRSWLFDTPVDMGLPDDAAHKHALIAVTDAIDQLNNAEGRQGASNNWEPCPLQLRPSVGRCGRPPVAVWAANGNLAQTTYDPVALAALRMRNSTRQPDRRFEKDWTPYEQDPDFFTRDICYTDIGFIYDVTHSVFVRAVRRYATGAYLHAGTVTMSFSQKDSRHAFNAAVDFASMKLLPQHRMNIEPQRHRY
jgi:hypothetical protein